MTLSPLAHRLTLLVVGALVPGYLLLDSHSAATATDTSAGPFQYEVSVTNLTRGQILSPPVVATHSAALPPLFTLGQPASPELVGVAEDAINQPLIDKLRASAQVLDVQAGAMPIPPGATEKIVVQGRPGRFNRLTVVGMLVITNDAFFAEVGGRLPLHGDAVVLSPAYDAGSEANTEQCAHIPGPPCNNMGVRVPQGAEGFVHIHAGIHGIGSLAPDTYDWRNPVAKISVRRL